ncbi:MAG TPA: TIGR01841 family phasin [Albitalea sp.]|nr:TIGR01841 family phasin [Albitalea sp.]HJW11995.1 TIGR01841 family phasin [Albitalea sp.]
MLTVEQVVAAQKASLGNVFGVTARAYEGFEKLVELNLQTGKSALTEVAQASGAALSVKDLASLQGLAPQPSVEKLTAYGRQVYDIVAATNADIGKLVEESAATTQESLAAVFDLAAKNAPAGSENVVAFVKSTVAAANSAFETVQKAVKQAADVAESNVAAVTSTPAKAGSSRKRAA